MYPITLWKQGHCPLLSRNTLPRHMACFKELDVASSWRKPGDIGFLGKAHFYLASPAPFTQPCPKPPGSTPAQRPALAPRVPQLHGRHQPHPQPPPAASPSPGRGFEDFSAASNSRSHRLCSEPLVGPRSRRSLRRPGSEAGDLAQDFAHLSPPPLHPAHSPERSVKSLHDGILLCYFNAILAQA